MESPAQYEVGPLAGSGVVPLCLPDVRREVRREVVVDPRRVRVERALEIDHGVERLDVRLHERRGILGHVAALGHDHRQRLALVPDPVAHERQGGPRVEDRALDGRWRHEHGAGAAERAKLGGREDGGDAGVRPRAAHIQRAEPAGGQVAAHECNVQGAGRLHVLDELRAAGQQTRVLVAWHAGPDPRPACPAHGSPSPSAARRSAASATPSTMLW